MNEIAKVVVAMNDYLWEECDNEQDPFWLETTRYEHRIMFKGIEIWSSGNDDRLYIESCDEYEPLLPHVQKLFNEMVDSLQLLKFKKKRKKK